MWRVCTLWHRAGARNKQDSVKAIVQPLVYGTHFIRSYELVLYTAHFVRSYDVALCTTGAAISEVTMHTPIKGTRRLSRRQTPYEGIFFTEYS